jgi:cytoskeletal protein CcmA (bactofilin family)
MTTIGSSLVIKGQITSREDITVHGRVNGQISMVEGSLLIAPTGQVDAEVDVTTVTIHGSLSGDVAANHRVELTPTATVKGTLLAPSVILREGASFNGRIEVDKKGPAARSEGDKKGLAAKGAAPKPN